MPNITENALQSHPIKHLPIYGLRLEIQSLILHFAEVFQCPSEFVTSSIFAIVSTCCGRHISIFDGKYTNHPNHWICHIADSGKNKSSPVKQLMEPISKENARRLERYKAELEEQKKSPDMEEPTFHPLVVSDVTPEALFKVMDDNINEKTGLILYRDEIKGFIDDMQRYNNSGEVSSYLSIWDGGEISVTRKTQTPIYIEKTYLSMMGGIQSKVIKKIFNEQMNEVGFTQRWLFVYPDFFKFQEYNKACLDQSDKDAWNEVITTLLNMDDMYLTLSPEALKVYIDYYNETGHKADELDSIYQSMFSKLRIQVLKWCAIVHVLSCHKAAGPGKYFVLPDTTVISAEEMQYSVECMRYFEYCGSKVLAQSQPASSPPTTTMTKKELLIALVKMHSKKNINIQKLADGLGVKRQYISKIINSDPELRGCGCAPHEDASVSEDCEVSAPQPCEQE